jgi:hypothetical protein
MLFFSRLCILIPSGTISKKAFSYERIILLETNAVSCVTEYNTKFLSGFLVQCVQFPCYGTGLVMIKEIS